MLVFAKLCIVGILLILFFAWLFNEDMADEFPHNKNKH